MLFAGFGKVDEDAQSGEATGEMRAIDATDAAIQMAYAEKVIIVPGYGLAVAQAQHKIWGIDPAVDVERGQGQLCHPSRWPAACPVI